MSRGSRRSWWAGITPAALIVVATLALCALAAAAAVCVRFATTGQLEAEGVTLLLGLTGTLGTLLARSKPDPAATIEAPADVTARSADEPAA